MPHELLPDGLRVNECPHCQGLGWYETGEKIESGNNWDEPYHCEYVEADCPYCSGTGWQEECHAA